MVNVFLRHPINAEQLRSAIRKMALSVEALNVPMPLKTDAEFTWGLSHGISPGKSWRTSQALCRTRSHGCSNGQNHSRAGNRATDRRNGYAHSGQIGVTTYAADQCIHFNPAGLTVLGIIVLGNEKLSSSFLI